ncbi:OLC1v1001259C1 [Oldenlandia corymbosa var. corymbosa]|uniref:OLC1v1001259C1 n=1 Tax=Oldenlandia corymbosa var. corymbosa TaxID=529605 RepID=A0AAV1D556_OLDCO|nr:OLC1v1001259C1 [Oldenlandia corymbosa var. corymbosa]
MESLLGFKDQPSSEVISVKSDCSFKLVPWINWEEWDFVKSSLFSSTPQSIATALQRITAWRSRGCLPVVIEVTASIIEIQQKDPYFRNDLSGKALDSEDMLAMLYCMAIMRLVNGVIEKTRKKKEVSIADAAGAIGIPRLLIDIRHESSHRDLPSLHLVRLASVKAVDWLKAYYWEPQKNAIPNLGDTATNRRSEIKHKLLELAFCLKTRRDSRSDSTIVKGKSSKKQVNKLVKNVIRFYSSSSGEVVEVLLELLLSALDSLDLVDTPEDQGNNHTAEKMPSAFALWKSVLHKLLLKQPELVWGLLNAFIGALETQAMKYQTDPGAQSRRSEQLVILIEWVIQNFLKSPCLSDSATDTEWSTMMKNYSKAARFELLRSCLVATSHGNPQLKSCVLALARMMENQPLLSKLEKFLAIAVPDVNADEASSSDDGISESFLSHQLEMINEAAGKLEKLKNHLKKNNRVETQIDDGKKGWVKVQSWRPCPLGMLPHKFGFSGHYPILDNKVANDRASSETETEKGQLECTQSSHKRASISDNDHQDRMAAKRLKETVDDSLIDDPENTTFEDFKGHLMIGGVWQKVKEEEVSAIASAIRILV